MLNRRQLIQNAGLMSAIAALGIRPEQVIAAEGGVLRARSELDVSIIDPGYQVGGLETIVCYACFPRLAVPVRGDDGLWGWAPSAFVEHLSQDDELTISFRLKPGIMWSDDIGELTAEDVKYTFERAPNTDWGNRFPTLERVDVTDRYSGTVVLHTPFAATFLLGIASETGSILPKAVMEGLPGERFTTQLPGQCGPYTMHEWRPRERMVFRANPDYPGEPPAFAEVQMLIIPDSSSAELAFEAGEVEITEVTPTTAARYLEQMPPGVALGNLEGGNLTTWIGLNSEHPLLSDIRVRKAIQRAVDVDSILIAAYGGVSPRSTGIIPPGMPGYRHAAGYDYDPDAARALLAEAGVSNLALEFRIQNDSLNLTVAQVVQANLAAVGITVTITPMEAGPYWLLGLEAEGDEWRDLQMYMLRFRTTPEPSDITQWFVGSQVGIWNWERWSDPEFDELYARGQTETDVAQRVAIYTRMQEIMEDTGCYVWITHDAEAFAFRDTLEPFFGTAGIMHIERTTPA